MGRKKDGNVAEPQVKRTVKSWYDKVEAFSWAPVSNGFGVHGIPDRVGCVPVVVTPDMVGKTVGVFVAVESKGSHRKNHKGGGLTPQQQDRRAEIRLAGGVCHVAYDTSAPEELNAILKDLTHG